MTCINSPGFLSSTATILKKKKRKQVLGARVTDKLTNRRTEPVSCGCRGDCWRSPIH
jgi:hypothetical protein